MKKSGFTLAEVLITLGIIGVVAALTAPALVMQSRNQANAARLSVAVSNLENAFSNAISTESVDSLFQTSIWINGFNNGGAVTRPGFVGNLKRYLNVTDFRDGDTATIRNYYNDAGGMHVMTATGGVGAAQNPFVRDVPFFGALDVDGSNIIIETKQGATYVISPFRTAALGAAGAGFPGRNLAISRGGGLLERAATVAIDVNGTAAPNTYGRDIFFFAIGSNGVLYPVGGTDVAIFAGQIPPLWTWNDANNGNTRCIDGNLAVGAGCTARVIADGYRINY